MKKIFAVEAVVFLSAFLLFEIELIVSKMLLPRFGGSYLVWGAGIVFFQAVLLLGYLYSHIAATKIGIRSYRKFHILLFLLPLLVFPGQRLVLSDSNFNLPVVLGVFLQLMLTIGPVFFVLSTTSIVFQSWVSESVLPESSNPYVLYAVSNMGSFAALLTYPFLFEAYLDSGVQVAIWRACYLLLVLLNIFVYFSVDVPEEKSYGGTAVAAFSGGRKRLLWFMLGAAGSMMFLSVTNIISYEIAPVPLIWIVPLCIYLLSFVLAFKKNAWYPRWIRDSFYPVSGLSILLFLLLRTRILPFAAAALLILASLFVICVFCQGELNRNRPEDKSELTHFYLTISLGSFAGGILVAWVFPVISVTMTEYAAGILLISAGLAVSSGGWNEFCLRDAVNVVCVTVLFFISKTIFFALNIYGIILTGAAVYLFFARFKKREPAFFAASALAFLLVQFSGPLGIDTGNIYRLRNYYGIYRLYEKDGKRYFAHGTTLHGAQYLEKDKRDIPLLYFHRETPIGEMMRSNEFDFKNIGIVGLGAGTLSAYARPGQNIDYFEIDPDVYSIATKYFSYLDDSRGKINCVMGDARLSLKKIDGKKYDILVIDAFSGDAIPLHLITTDAITEYRKRITENGLIVFHISNRYLNLAPVLASNAGALGAYSARKIKIMPDNSDALSSEWFEMTWNKKIHDSTVTGLRWEDAADIKKIRPWTDEYSSITSVIKTRGLLSNLISFNLK